MPKIITHNASTYVGIKNALELYGADYTGVLTNNDTLKLSGTNSLASVTNMKDLTVTAGTAVLTSFTQDSNGKTAIEFDAALTLYGTNSSQDAPEIVNNITNNGILAFGSTTADSDAFFKLGSTYSGTGSITINKGKGTKKASLTIENTIVNGAALVTITNYGALILGSTSENTSFSMASLSGTSDLTLNGNGTKKTTMSELYLPSRQPYH